MASSGASSAFARVLTVERDPRGPWLWVATAGLLLAGTLWVGFATDFLPCTLDCGETYEAHVAARNLWRFGWSHAGVQDFAANPSPVAHPTLYIHNPNLGMYALAGLYWLGMRSIHAQTPWLLLPFLGGLAYLYAAIQTVSRSRLVAGCCLLQAVSLYLLVVLWQFDALRVWSWLLTWGVVYHLVRWGETQTWPHASLVGLYLALGMGVDYPFAGFLAGLAVACSLLGVTRIGPLRVGLLVLGAVGGAFVLRQGQVAFAVGPAVWWTDLTMTILRRLPLATALGPAPDPAAFARAHALVIWPGGGGAFLPVTWAWILIRAYLAVLGWPILLVGGGWLWAVSLRRQLEGPVRRTLDLSLALAGAFVLTFAVFGEYVASFYGVYLMPLVVQGVVPVLGLTSAVVWTHRRARWRTVPVGLLLVLALVGWRGGVEARNIWTLPPVGYPGREALADSPGSSVATLWISSAPSAYTDQWGAALQTMRWLVQGQGGDLRVHAGLLRLF